MEEKQKDYTMIYVGFFAFVFVAVLLAVKSAESDKFAPIKEQIAEENAQMNVRVVKTDYEI